jgi:hypothetical protein
MSDALAAFNHEIHEAHEMCVCFFVCFVSFVVHY